MNLFLTAAIERRVAIVSWGTSGYSCAPSAVTFALLTLSPIVLSYFFRNSAEDWASFLTCDDDVLQLLGSCR